MLGRDDACSDGDHKLPTVADMFDVAGNGLGELKSCYHHASLVVPTNVGGIENDRFVAKQHFQLLFPLFLKHCALEEIDEDCGECKSFTQRNTQASSEPPETQPSREIKDRSLLGKKHAHNMKR